MKYYNVVTNHVTCNNQSEHIISESSIYWTLNFLYEIGSWRQICYDKKFSSWSVVGCFVEIVDSNEVTSVSNIGQMATLKQKATIEEEMKLQNRILKIEVEALNSQLCDVEQVQRDYDLRA